MKTNIIYNEDCIKGLKRLPNKSVDCIITDPPYGINKKGIINDDSLDVFYKSLPEMYRVLKEDSWFITFTSVVRLPEMFLNNPFNYRWLGFIYYKNIQRIIHAPMGRSKQSTYLVFQKGKPKRHAFINDVQEHTYPSKEDEVNHPAPKPIRATSYLVKCFSKENDVVLDPFIGSGTTAVACKQLKRDFIGFEIVEEYVDIANKRLQQEILKTTGLKFTLLL